MIKNNKLLNIIKIDKIFIAFLCFTGVIDLINGLVISITDSTYITVGKLIRPIFLLVIALTIIKAKNKKDLIILTVISIYFIGDNIATYFFYKEIGVLFSDLINVSKLLMLVGIIIAGKVLIEEKKITKADLNRILVINLRVISISLIICKIFNLGESAYVNDIGFKGYFYSNNELSIVLSLMLMYCCDSIYINIIKGNKISKWLFWDFISVLVVLLLIGAKTSFIVTVVTLLIYIIRVFKKINFFNNIKVISIISISSIVAIFIFSILFNKEINEVFNKLLFQFQNRDMMSFVLSDRNLHWQNMKETYIYGNNNLIDYLVGFRRYPVNGTTFINIELDAHAIYFNFGIIGLIITTVFFIKIFISTKKKFILIYPFVIYILFSITAGHVFFGAFAGTIFAIHCLIMIESKYT